MLLPVRLSGRARMLAVIQSGCRPSASTPCHSTASGDPIHQLPAFVCWSVMCTNIESKEAQETFAQPKFACSLYHEPSTVVTIFYVENATTLSALR